MSLTADLLKVLDYTVGRGLCRVLAPLSKNRSESAVQASPRRILIIRPGGIGDAVLFIPMLRELKRVWPAAELELLAERRNASVVAPSGLLHRVYRYDEAPLDLWRVIRRDYDLVIDTEQFHSLSAVVAWLTGAPRRIGFGTTVRRRLLTDPVPYSLETYEARSFLELARRATGRDPVWSEDATFYPVPDASRRFAEQALRPLAGLPKVAIHPGASIPERRWPTERYGTLARLLAERGVGVVILGGPTDRKTGSAIAAAVGAAPHIDLAGRCTLADAAGVVASCNVYISADSGVLHLAYGVGTPTVHLFGPGVLSKWGPPGKRFRSIAADVPCSPCTTYGYTPPCCQGVICMLRITPEQVLAAALEQLAAERVPERTEEAPR
jgi:ADP-heptose:LPS heptosyltransferase